MAKLLDVHPNSYIINKLWEQSGHYLHISGDRDLYIQKTHWSNRFYILQQDSIKLFYKLRAQTLC